MELSEFQKMAVTVGLKNMFNGEMFNICDLRHALTICGAKLSTKDDAALSMLHCIKFADMPKELRQMLFLKCMEVLKDGKEFDLALIDSALDSKSGSRLLN